MSGSRLGSIVCSFCGVLVTMSAACWMAPLHAEDGPDNRGIEPPIAYRRIFVPADDRAAWPRDGEKYLPVEARDFEAWVAAANRAASSGPPAAAITEAVYTARLEGGQLADGRGKWTIAVRGRESALVALGRMSLEVGEAHWKDEPAAAVRLGAWGRSGGLPSTMGLEAARSGVVAFQWRVPAPDAAGELVFPWRVPPAATTRLILDLPAEKRPIWEGSLILRSEELPTDGKTSSTKSPGPDASSAPRVEPTRWRRWEMIAGPEPSADLRIVDAETGPAVAKPAPAVVMREELSYDISPRGLDIDAQLRLEGSAAAHRELSIPLPAGVQLESAMVDGREVPWRLASDRPAAGRRAIVELPNAAAGAATTVVLRAWQAIVVDTAWQLPKLRPDDVFWASGSIHLSLAPPVELRSLERSDCLQTDVQLAADVNRPETISLAEYSPAASIKVVVGQRTASAQARIGTTLVVGNADLTGRCVTQLDVGWGSLHALSGELPPGWIVDAVETTPSDALGEWYVEKRDGGRHVDVQLADAVRPGRRVTVTLTGRLQQTSFAAPVPAATLRMVRWREVELARHLLMVQTVEPYVVETVGDVPLVAAETLTEEDRALLPTAVEGQIYDMREVGDAAGVRWATKKGQYTAEIWLDATLAGDELRQTYHVVSRPQTGRVDQILVFASAKVDGEIRWTEKTEGTPITAERLPPDDPRRTRLPADGGLWQLHLPRPRAKSVEIDATLTNPWTTRGSVPLLSLPEATDQRGRVLLRVDGERTPQLEAHGLRPIPLPTDGTSETAREAGLRLWAAYRYEPADCHDAARRPQLWLDPTANGTAARPAVARRLELESYFAAGGEAAHQATYHLENDRAESVELQLPEGARLTSAQMDGRMLDLPTAQDASRPLVIRLPAGRTVIVSLGFTTAGRPLAAGSKLRPPQLADDMPMLAGEWTIWLPTEFVALGTDAATADGGQNWRQRLLGPLGRPTGARPFDPLHGGAWTSLLAGWADETPLAERMEGEISSESGREDASAVADLETRAGDAASAAERVFATGARPPSERDGWRAYRRMFVARMPEAIVVAHPPATGAWSVAMFLLCLAGGGMLRRRREWFIGLTATAAILCLVLPAAQSPLATGAFLGLLASLVVAWPRRADPADAPTRTWTRLTASGATATALAIVLANLATAQQTGDAGGSGQSTEPATIHRVLIPVDAARRPVGNKIYVSEQFLRRLLANGAEPATASREWLLTKAAYRGELRHGAEGEELVAGEWTMTLGIEVLGRDTTIVLPLVRDEAAWLTTVQLDGIPLPLEWGEDGRSCAIDVAEPGRYDLTVSFVPRLHDVAGRNQVELTLPPWLGAALELRHPAEVSGLEVVGANWQRRDDRDAGLRHGGLDDSGRMVIRWPRAETPAGPKDVRLTELRWLRVSVAGVEMDVKYVAPRDAQLPPEFVISADRHWEVMADQKAVENVSIAAESGGRNVVRVGLRADDAARGEVTLRWRLADPAGLGRLRLPSMELVSPQASSSWLAISSDATLECEIVDAAGLPAETAEEFLAVWGTEESHEPPQLVLGNIGAGDGLSVALRPRSAEAAIDEVLYVAGGADAVRVQYQAEVAPGRTHCFQFPMTVPAELAVDQIAVTQAGRPIALRWSRPSASRVNVFFAEQLTEPYRLTLAGHVSVRGSNGCVLPRVASASLNAVVERVQVYRDEAVLVEVQGPANADDAAADLPPAGWNARLVAAYQLDSSVVDQVRLAISPNRVETVGETLTTLSHEEAVWRATFNSRLVVRQGELDTLRLRVPATWMGPYEVQPAGASATAAAAPDGEHAILSVRLPEPIGAGEAFSLEIRGSLVAGGGSPVTVPEVVPETPSQWRSYVSVPTSVQSQAVAWTREGARPAEPPGNLRPSRATPSPAKTFRVTASPYRVALAPPQAVQPKASVRLADTIVVRGATGNQLVATRFVIAPQGLADCELQLPAGQELVDAKLDGQPARTRRLDERRWGVSLGAPQLPQILDIVSRDIRHAAPSGRRVELQRPTLVAGGTPIPVEMSLWSFGQWQIAGQPRVDGAALVAAVDQAALRLDRLASIAEAATPAAVGLPIPDGYYWFRAWAEMLTDAQEVAHATLATSLRAGTASQVSRAGGEPLTAAVQRIATWMERCYDVLGWPDLGPPLKPPGAANDHRYWPPRIDGVGNWIDCVADGSADRMTVELRPADVASGSARMLGVLAIAGVAAASVWLMRQSAARDLLYRWPHAVGVLAGVIWWAWLWPSWLGLFIAAGSLLLLFWSGWPGRALRTEGSTVLQIGRPR